MLEDMSFTSFVNHGPAPSAVAKGESGCTFTADAHPSLVGKRGT